MVIATREDPNLPLARLRAQGQLAELRAADLRFEPRKLPGSSTRESASRYPLTPSPPWRAAPKAGPGRQLAAISLRGHPDAAGFISSFSGSHRFVLDYLLEEVLRRQPAAVQSFLLQTSYSADCAAPCATPSWMTPPRQGVRRWSISSEPTCSSSPWITGGVGTAITISSPMLCGNGCSRVLPRPRGALRRRGGAACARQRLV